MKQELRFARGLMVVASLAPLFAIWAIKGSSYIPDKYFVPTCLGCIIVPNAILALRIFLAKKNSNTKKIIITNIKDQNDNLLLYLFAMLIPLITGDLDSGRSFATMIGALGFLAFLFWHLNLFYLNIAFAIFGYKMYTVYPNDTSGDFTPLVLLTKRNWVKNGVGIDTWRISDTVFIERETNRGQHA